MCKNFGFFWIFRKNRVSWKTLEYNIGKFENNNKFPLIIIFNFQSIYDNRQMMIVKWV